MGVAKGDSVSKRWWLWLLGGVLLIAVTVVTTLIVVSPVALQPNAAPWWGIPTFTLAGSLGAAALAGTFLLRNERRKAEIVANQSHAALERDVSSQFLVQADKECYTKKATKSLFSEEATAALLHLQLIMDPEIGLSAHRLLQAATVVARSSEAEHMPFEMKHDASTFYYEARGTFRNIIRTRFGLPPLNIQYERDRYPPGMHEAMFGITEDEMYEQ